MHRMKVILEKYGHPVTMLTETGVGYEVYEDEFQVVADNRSPTLRPAELARMKPRSQLTEIWFNCAMLANEEVPPERR